jgi:wobble nucleotide-excising tRNase
MNGVASYTSPAVLETDKKITLIYGLNGTGKSTLSNFLSDPTNHIYSACTIEGLDDSQVYVYNNRFVKDNFHEMDKLKGIFTLSKPNKHVEEELDTARKALKDQQAIKNSIESAIAAINDGINAGKVRAEEVTWKIKTKFAGGDRVLEYCLDGLKAKGRLFDHIAEISLANAKPIKTTDDLKKEADSLQGDSAQRYSKLSQLISKGTSTENNPLFAIAVVGNQDGPVANLIKRLNNADWVSEGIPFMDVLQDEGEQCPFCQAKTLTAFVSDAIRNYFDETFKTSVQELKNLLQAYRDYTSSIPAPLVFLDISFLKGRKAEFEALYGQLQSTLSSNIQLIERKIKSPSNIVTLASSLELIEKINAIIDSINQDIDTHNTKIDNKSKALNDIKSEFWEICRWEYDQTITPYKSALKDSEEKLRIRKEELAPVVKTISELTSKIISLQKETVNIDAAIMTINSRLIDLGIDSFKIIKHSENSYRLSRNGVASEDFQSLSEGEKTVISFVYFVELCKGKRTAEDVSERKIVVIDDPISSLSHIYVFNIGQMLKQELCNSEQFAQIIVLTHSLYFFYELTDIKKERRDNTQKLLRMIKNSAGSKIVEMKYEEIQNDYQSYWTIVTDEQQPPALIANCMRNIVEYFFNFVRKQDLNNVFQQPSLADPKHQAFYRFMNRESHSLGQNIFDYKEFDYARFHEAFKLLFEETGFSEHYKAMTK